jgi:hypothetical protein
MNKAQTYVNSLSPEEREDVAKALAKLNRKPMPGWKKKLYLGMFTIGGVWCLFQYLHYEACREKYPQASGWVCLMAPR